MTRMSGMTLLSWLISTQYVEQIGLTSGHRGWFTLRRTIGIDIVRLVGIIVLVDGLHGIVESKGAQMLLMRMLVAELEGHKSAVRWQRSFLLLCAITIENDIILVLLLLLLLVLLLLMLNLLVALFGFLGLLEDPQTANRLGWLAIQGGIEGSTCG